MNRSVVKVQIIAAVILNAVQIAACFADGNFGRSIIFMLVTNAAYILWAEFSSEGYTPWGAYLGFIIAENVQFTLNIVHIVPPDSSIVLSGFGQGLYCAGLVITSALFGIVNLIRYIIYLRRYGSRSARDNG